jgi:hypothetical protein
VSIEAFDKLATMVSELPSGDFAVLVCGYIDPNTMHHVFSFFAPVIAVLAMLLSVTALISVLFRNRLVGLLAKRWPVKLAVAAIVLIALALIVLRLGQNQPQGN